MEAAAFWQNEPKVVRAYTRSLTRWVHGVRNDWAQCRREHALAEACPTGPQPAESCSQAASALLVY